MCNNVAAAGRRDGSLKKFFGFLWDRSRNVNQLNAFPLILGVGHPMGHPVGHPWDTRGKASVKTGNSELKTGDW